MMFAKTYIIVDINYGFLIEGRSQEVGGFDLKSERHKTKET